ncbi:MAG: hypothetical protein D3909_14500 [Candidatus Electrothrix sp. ATG1]|nr:hypothetical protein [Candidatus Electrothrix sp. ATG1]
MKIFRATLNKDVLEKIPDKEKTLLFGFAHFANEIKFLFRSIQWSSDYTSSNDAVQSAQISLSFFYTKLLAGKLKEGREMFEKTFKHNREIKEIFKKRGSKEGNQALSQLEKIFGGGTPIHSIRNNYAFHYNPHNFNSVTIAQEELEIFGDKETNINTLYYFSEVVVNKSMLDGIDNSDLSNAMERFHDEINLVTGYFRKFCDELIHVILEKYAPEIWKGYAEEIQLDELEEFATSKIHWFTDTSSLRIKTNNYQQVNAHDRNCLRTGSRHFIGRRIGFIYSDVYSKWLYCCLDLH